MMMMKGKNIISAVFFVLCTLCVDSSVSQGLPTTNTKHNKCNLQNVIYFTTYVLQCLIFSLKWDILPQQILYRYHLRAAIVTETNGKSVLWSCINCIPMTHLVVKFIKTQHDAKTLQQSHCALEQFSLKEMHW